MAWREDAVIGKLTVQRPLMLAKFTVATVPDATKYTGSIIFVSNGAAGDPVLATSDGTDWLRSDTNAAISLI